MPYVFNRFHRFAAALWSSSSGVCPLFLPAAAAARAAVDVVVAEASMLVAHHCWLGRTTRIAQTVAEDRTDQYRLLNLPTT